MAIMYPPRPKEYPPESREGEIFEALEYLPDDYYVFHSVTVLDVNNFTKNREIDFLIFHPKKGILCIEAKAGRIKFKQGGWFYGNGKPINQYGGPLEQARSGMHKLMEYIENKYKYLKDRCVFQYAGWFLDVPEANLQGISLPPDTSTKFILTEESRQRERVQRDIDRIFSLKVKDKETNLSEKDIKTMLNGVLAPEFNLVTIKASKKARADRSFVRLLNNQLAILDFLVNQPSAVITGMAGTGKTVIAREKARRHGEDGEKTLFLCYNRLLCDTLKTEYAYDNVTYSTLDAFAMTFCNIGFDSPQYRNRYKLLREKLESFWTEMDDTPSRETMEKYNFKYQHVIIDEGQDFGVDDAEGASVLDLLQSCVLDNRVCPGTFYVFYDENQLVQSKAIPDCLKNADCKLDLNCNCRNTRYIADTASRLLPLPSDKSFVMVKNNRKRLLQRKMERRNKLFNSADIGDKPQMFIGNTADVIKKLDASIEALKKDQKSGVLSSIQIITCETLGENGKSLLQDYCEENKEITNIGKWTYKGIPVETYRRFKGLEADAVILVDMNYKRFLDDTSQCFYVASSRAKYKLILMVNMSNEECEKIVEAREMPHPSREKDMRKIIGNWLGVEVLR